MMIPAPEKMEKIAKKHKNAQKYFKNRALMVIETLCMGDIVYTDIEKLQSDIYEIAHSAINICDGKHENWRENTENTFKEFKKLGLI